MADEEVAWDERQVTAQSELMLRSEEEVEDPALEVDVGRAIPVRGHLIVESTLRRPCRFYLDVEGAGRFVLVQDGDKFTGVAFLPQGSDHEVATLNGSP